MSDHASGLGVVVVSDILIDLIEEADGGQVARAGGAGFNLAAAVRLLGTSATLVAPVADDADGRFLAAAAKAARVTLVALENPWPTTVATSRRINGEPHYTFSEWIRERRFVLGALDAGELTGNVLAVNSFPMHDPTQVRELIALARRAGLQLVTDPNARPTLLTDVEAYRAGFDAVAAVSVVVKLSAEDIEHLRLGTEEAAVQHLFDLNVPTIVVTRAARDSTAYLSGGRQVTVPIPHRLDPVIDTLGAGDAVLARIACEISRLGPDLDTDQWTTILREAMDLAADVCRIQGGVLESLGRQGAAHP